MRKKAEPMWADLKALIDRYGNSILRFCYLYLLDLEQAQKVAEDVFVRAYAHPDFSAKGFDEKRLLRITVHQCRKHTSRHTQCIMTEENPILSAFQHMTALEREMILLHYYMGFAPEDVASVSGLPVFVIRHFLSAGNNRLECRSLDSLTD